MMRMLCLLLVSATLGMGTAHGGESRYAQWQNGPSTSPDYFPLAVWLQDPVYATQWRQAHINLYVGLWRGPTAAQLNHLKAADMQVIAHQNPTALEFGDVTVSGSRPLIVAYMHGDEPDNAQRRPEGGYGPPVPTANIQEDYRRLKKADPTRPILLNLGQGIAWDSGTWVGQGGRIVPDRDYPAYIAGSDIASFDIYPMDCSRNQTCGDMWRIALGLDRLRKYSPEGHIRWNCIETGDISANGKKITPEGLRGEVWMSIVHGSRGIVYFIHGKSATSNFDRIALLQVENAEMFEALKRVNAEVLSLARVINTGEPAPDRVQPVLLRGDTPIDTLVLEHDGDLYIFSVAMRPESARVRFAVSRQPDAQVEVLGEDRTVPLKDGVFQDDFTGYAVHLYRIPAPEVAAD